MILLLYFIIVIKRITYVTGFDKTRLPHTSNALTCNLTTQYAIGLKVSQNESIASTIK